MPAINPCRSDRFAVRRVIEHQPIARAVAGLKKPYRRGHVLARRLPELVEISEARRDAMQSEERVPKRVSDARIVPARCVELDDVVVVDAATRAAGYATERSGKTCFVAREDDDCAALVRGQSASPV